MHIIVTFASEKQKRCGLPVVHTPYPGTASPKRKREAESRTHIGATSTALPPLNQNCGFGYGADTDEDAKLFCNLNYLMEPPIFDAQTLENMRPIKE